MTKVNIPETINDARRVSTPLIAISTPDPAALIKQVVAGLPDEVMVVEWDVVNGMQASRANSEAAREQMVGDNDNTVNNPSACAVKADKLPANTILFMLQADRWLSHDHAGYKFAMACWNLRDTFKMNRRTLILLGHDVSGLPTELAGDTLQLDDPLPDKEEVRQVITDNVIAPFNAAIDRKNETLSAAEQRPNIVVQPKQLADAVNATLGLTAYQVEQFTAMATRGSGINIGQLRERKEKQIEQTPGLSVFSEANTFDGIGGCQPVKTELTALMTSSKREFQAVVWMDEIEKSGLGNTSDLSGVNSDAEGTILTYMEDHNPYAVMLLGLPGTGKSEIAKATGGTFDKPTIRFDQGAMMGPHVGESQRYLRQALRVITAVTNDNGLWIATSNTVANLSAALQSRFSDVFFFDLPSRDELEVIWKIWCRKFDLDDQPLPNDDGWVGRNVKKCCEKAWIKGISLIEAADTVVPMAESAMEDIKALRQQASGRFLSASTKGVYYHGKGRQKARAPRDVSLN